MAINSRFFQRVTLLLIFFGLTHLLTAESSNFFVDTRGRINQRLTWSGGEYALRYEVVVERQVNGTFRHHERHSTTNNFITVLLPPGVYRFQVIPFDILDRPVQASEWRRIEILRAYRPQLRGTILGFSSVANNDGVSGYVINVSGSDIQPGADIFLRASDNTRIRVEPVLSPDDSNMWLFIEESLISPGEYEIIVRNPGGLEDRLERIILSHDLPALDIPGTEREHERGIELTQEREREREAGHAREVTQEREREAERAIEVAQQERERELAEEFEAEHEIEQTEEDEVKPKEKRVWPPRVIKPVVWNIGAGLTPTYTLFSHFDNVSAFFPWWAADISVVFSSPSIYTGVELSGSYLDSYETLSVEANINFLMRKYFSSQKSALNFRIGAGSIKVIDSPENYADEAFWSNMNFWLNIGSSFYFHILRYFYFEAGINYKHFIFDNAGYLQPKFALGFWF